MQAYFHIKIFKLMQVMPDYKVKIYQIECTYIPQKIECWFSFFVTIRIIMYFFYYFVWVHLVKKNFVSTFLILVWILFFETYINQLVLVGVFPIFRKFNKSEPKYILQYSIFQKIFWKVSFVFTKFFSLSFCVMVCSKHMNVFILQLIIFSLFISSFIG